MARGNRLLGTLRGKLGDTVYYRSRGYQIERPRVVPKNPRTRAQMMQRVKIADVSAVYRALKTILSRSFVVRGQHESSFNAFSRAALDLSPYMTKSMVAKCLALPMPVQLSRGGLGTYDYTTFQLRGQVVYAVLPSLTSGNGDAAPTVSEWSERFIEANPQFEVGDIITNVLIRFNANDQVQEEDAFNAAGRFAQITLDLDDIRPITEAGFALDTTNDILIPNGWPSTDAAAAEDLPLMSGIFVSRKIESGDVDVSSQYFVLNEGAISLYAKYRSSDALNDAISSYGVGSERAV